jgi:hypothetical protein
VLLRASPEACYGVATLVGIISLGCAGTKGGVAGSRPPQPSSAPSAQCPPAKSAAFAGNGAKIDDKCGRYGIHVTEALGCAPDQVEPEVMYWGIALGVLIEGMLQRDEITPEEARRPLALSAEFDAEGKVLSVKSVSRPPVPQLVEDRLPMLKEFPLTHPLGRVCSAMIAWDATCLQR